MCVYMSFCGFIVYCFFGPPQGGPILFLQYRGLQFLEVERVV